MVNLIKVSDVIAEYLEIAGIRVVFGIIGSANSHIFDSITKRGYTEIVCVHHEQAAVMAMGAYYRASGKLSAAIVTAGAGSSNAITGVLSNWADSIPGIIFSGQEQLTFMNKYEGLRMYGIQGYNSPKMVEDITKFSITIKNEKDVQIILEYAHKITMSDRPGPVWIDIPFDIQSKKIETPTQWDLKVINSSNQFDASPVAFQWDLDYVIKGLQEAKRPLIWAGHGVRLSGAREEFKKLVDKLQIPVLLTWSGIDLLHDKHPYYFGRAGVTGMRYSNFIVQNCDFLLVLGSRLSLLQTGYDLSLFAPNAKIVTVDIDSTEQKKHGLNKYDRIINFDCKQFIEELSDTTSRCNIPEWIEYCNKVKQNYPLLEKCHDNKSDYINSYHFLDKLSDYIDDDAIIVTDMGTALLSGHYSMRLKPNQIMFTSLGLGEMGYGLPGAIGAAKAFPNRQIICLNCDGGMMMNLQELQTIIHHKMNIKIVIFNNDGYLMIKHTQNMLFKGYRTSVSTDTGLSLPNYHNVGAGFGFRTWKLNSWLNFEDVINEYLEDKDPSILEVFMDPEQDFLPKVKGLANEDGTITPAPLEEMYPLLSIEEMKEVMINGLSERSKTIVRPII